MFICQMPNQLRSTGTYVLIPYQERVSHLGLVPDFVHNIRKKALFLSVLIQSDIFYLTILSDSQSQ